MKRIISLLVAFLLFSCVHHVDDRSEADLAIVLSPTFEQISTNPNLLGHAAESRATATAFEVGDQIGLYATMAGQAITAVGNHVNNKKFIAAADGSIAAAPAVYYPDTKAPAKLCAYYPYSASVSDATKIEFEVTEDIKASDLCYARAEALPSADPQPLRFTHQLSRTIFTIALPTGATLQKAELLNVQSQVTLNMNDGSITNGSTRKNITLYNNSEAIVPAQTFAAGEKMLIITVTQNATSQIYHYTPSASTTLEQGQMTTFNLTLNDNLTATLASATVVEPWTTQTITGDINQTIGNSFTAHWALPNAKYALATQATLTIKNLKTNVSKDYPTTNFKVKTESSSALMCSYTFDFAPSAAELLGYPYQIEAITFKDASNNSIQACTAIIAKSVYKRGDYWLGIEAGNLLVVSTTPLTNWGTASGGGSIAGGGVTNDFMVTMVEPSYAYGTIQTIELTIDGAVYSFTALAADPTSNKLLARSSFALPDKSGKSPAIYPYTIERVTLKNASSSLLYDGYCNVVVSSGGRVGLSLYTGGVISTSAAVTASGWGTVVAGSGEAIYTGPVTSNLFSFTYANGLATAAAECASVNRVELTIGGSQVVFASVAMTGNRFVASSGAYDIVSATGSRPTTYPYSITRIDFYNGATLVESVIPTVPILVSGSGAVSVSVVQ